VTCKLQWPFHVFQQVDDLLFFKDMSILVVQTCKVSFREKRAENVTSQLLWQIGLAPFYGRKQAFRKSKES
jgi:hypothetical protein